MIDVKRARNMFKNFIFYYREGKFEEAGDISDQLSQNMYYVYQDYQLKDVFILMSDLKIIDRDTA